MSLFLLHNPASDKATYLHCHMLQQGLHIFNTHHFIFFGMAGILGTPVCISAGSIISGERYINAHRGPLLSESDSSIEGPFEACQNWFACFIVTSGWIVAMLGQEVRDSEHGVRSTLVLEPQKTTDKL
jgi:hypothetical protein